MEWVKDYIWLIPLMPLVGFIFNATNAFFNDKIFGKKTKK